jgi:hypothetical protein
MSPPVRTRDASRDGTTKENTMTTERTRSNPPLVGALAYLVLNLPIGIVSFVFTVTMLSVGFGTAIVWVGLAVLAFAILGCRGFAELERTRAHAMLGTYIASPYRPLPDSGGRWPARLKDPATWKDMAYCVLLLPIGIAEFTIVITSWATGLWLTLLPIVFVWLPADWRPELWHHVVFDSWPMTLPWAAVGMLILAAAIALTRGLGSLHARYARAILGPSTRHASRLWRLSTAGAIDWSNTSHRPVSP